MHAHVYAAFQAVVSDSDGLTLLEVLGNVPHNPAAIFTYILLVATFGGIFWVGRPRKPGPTSTGA